ncbi:MAG: hypothetical protein K9M80_01270 [Candidatus Marinimicrobia bacterium]|nr:hypothetical protein [Candidatus Neomarinimicrobiota bacterium]
MFRTKTQRTVILIIIILCTSCFAQHKSTRKAITYIPFLLQKEDYNIDTDDEKYILDTLRDAISLDRFNYNPLPEPLVKKFRREMKGIQQKKSVTKELLKRKIKQYLLPEIEKVHNIQLEMRAKDLVTETDKNRFIVQKAKESGIDADDLKKVLNSAFIYVPYLKEYKIERKTEKEDKKVKVSEDKYKTKEVEKKVIEVQTNLDVLWYKISFVNDKPKLYYIQKPKQGFFKELLDLTDIGSSETCEIGETYKFDGQKVSPIEYAFKESIWFQTEELARLTKKYPAFKLNAQVRNVADWYLSFDLGTKEGINIDDGYYICEKVQNNKGDFKRKRRGFVKVRQIGKNRTFNQTEPSHAQIITGTQLTKGMQAVEYPMGLGSFIPMMIKTPCNIDDGKLENIKFKESRGSNSGGGIQIEADIGNSKYLSKKWSEVWLGMGLGFSSVNYKYQDYPEIKEDQGSIFKIDFNMRKKYYFRRLAPYLGGGMGIGIISINNPKGKGSFSSGVYGLNLQGGLELFITPKFSIGAGLGAFLSSTNSEWDKKYEENDEEYTEEDIEGPEVNMNGFTNIFYINFTF